MNTDGVRISKVKIGLVKIVCLNKEYGLSENSLRKICLTLAWTSQWAAACYKATTVHPLPASLPG